MLYHNNTIFMYSGTNPFDFEYEELYNGGLHRKYGDDYCKVYLATLKMMMRANRLLSVPIPERRLRNKIVKLARKENYRPIIISDQRICDAEHVSPSEPLDLVKPRVKRFDAAFVIGDVHGCLGPLQRILSLSRGYPIVFVGDLVDKGQDQEGVLDLVYGLLSNNPNEIAITPGNHDTSYKYRIEMDGAKRTQTISDKLDKVLTYRSDWVEGPGWIVTHSPCHPKYLRKNDEASLMRSINFRRASQGLTTKELVEERMKSWGRTNKDRHIFGHVAFDDVWRFKNLVGIDTGCVYGGKLTGYFTDSKTWVQV